MFALLATTTPPPTLNLQTLGQGAMVTAGLTPFFNAFAQHIKQFPIRNHWLKQILPLMGVIAGVGLCFIVYHLGTRDPLFLLTLFVGCYTAPLTAMSVYETQKVVPGIPTFLPPGPDNHPLDAHPAIPPPPPASPVAESDDLPPSPFMH